MKAAKPILLSLLLSAFLVGCGDSSTGSNGGDSSDDLSSGTSFVPGSSDEGDSSEELSSDEETSGSSSSRVGKSSAKVSSSSSIAVDYNALCGATPYDSTTHFCDIRDSAVYAMVRIGSQTWMKENLNHEYGFDGHKYGSYCYHDSAMYCAKYGKLYTWAAAMDSVNTGCGDGAYCDADTGRVQGVCPDGWHLPDTVEWRSLFAAVGGKSVAGTALKSATGWKEGNDPFPGTPFPATNSSGFSALPSGFRYEFTMYDSEGLYAIFWSTSEHDGPRSAHDGRQAFSMAVSSNFPDAGLTYRNKILGLAVRCVKNQ